MSTAVLTNRIELNSLADTALKAAARFWFGVTVIGQLAFGFAVASFYGLTRCAGITTDGNLPTVTFPA